MSPSANLLKLLLPPVAYDKNGPALSAAIEAEGIELDKFQGTVGAALLEIDARSATYLLPDFERVYGLPDECRGAAETITDRRLRLAAKIAETGGISRSYFQTLAAALGYQNVTITSFKQTTCEAPCDAQLLDESWRFGWRVNLPGQADVHRYASCEAGCGDSLETYKQGPLECLLNKLSPPESVVMFNYEG
jgi:uncharacterized protein YmfQ (DUF2313 family)